MLNDETRDAVEKWIKERTEGDMAEMQKKSEYSVIWVAVANGYSDDVIRRPGRPMQGRHHPERPPPQLGTGFHASGHLHAGGTGFCCDRGPREQKTQIMSAICTSCGLKTPAHGVVLSLPVEEAIGLEQ